MNIQELPTAMGFDVNANVLKPAAGDLVVLKAPSFLSVAQRDKLNETLKPMFDGLGCKFLVLEGGFDLALIKKPETTPTDHNTDQALIDALSSDSSARSAFYQAQCGDVKAQDASA
jgi:hypothetical protein